MRGMVRALASSTMIRNKTSAKQKLSLNPETLRALTSDQLGKVAGGDPYSKLSVCELNACTRSP